MNFYFMAGMPRSGSTLLSALLNQRGDLFCSSSSGTVEIFEYLNEIFVNSESFKSGVYVDQKNSICKNLLYSAYEYKNLEFIVDKSRLWTLPKYHNLLKNILPYSPKFLIPIRPLDEIVSSFIRLFEENPGNYIDKQLSDCDFMQWPQYKNISDARVDALLSPYSHIRTAMSALYFAMSNDDQESFFYVKYDELINDPKTTMMQIEVFLNIPPFEYDFNNIVGEKHNDLETWGVKDMHTVKNKIISKKSENILSEYAQKRCALEDFWTQYII